MKTQEHVKPKRKGRGCWIALLVFLILLAVGGGIGWSFIAKEHQEAANLPLNAVDFTRLKDGAYHGAYAGGMYRWRANECDVTVVTGKVTGIQLQDKNNPNAQTADVDMLYERVIQTQSLQVDTISGATLTTKGYLQCVENALVQAQ